MQSVLFDPSIQAYGLFDKDNLERRVREHLSGKRNNGRLLFRLLNLALWWDEYQVQS